MPRTLKHNALLVFGLAILFWWSFMFAKHDQHLRNIIPFGNDPYDAVGSFGTIVSMLAALLSLVRAFRPYRQQAPSNSQCIYLVRSQEAVVLTVLLTLLADMIAMLRHRALWATSGSNCELIVLLCSLALMALAVQLRVSKSQTWEAPRFVRPGGAVGEITCFRKLTGTQLTFGFMRSGVPRHPTKKDSISGQRTAWKSIFSAESP